MAEETADRETLAQSPATPTLKSLIFELKSVSDWHSLGVNLDLKNYQLSEIERNYPGDVKRCKTEMLACWLENTTTPTWEAISEALCLMEAHAVADKIRRKYTISTATTEGSQVKTQALAPQHMDDNLVLARENLKKIKFKYASLFTLALCVLQEKNIDVSILRAFLTALCLPEEHNDDNVEINPSSTKEFINELLGTAQSVGDIFESLTKNGMLSYKNFYILRSIIDQFAGDDTEMKSRLDKYDQELAGYMLVTKIKDFLAAETHQSEQSEPDSNLLSVEGKVNIVKKAMKYVSELWGLLVGCKQPRPDPKLLHDLSVKVKANVTERTLKYVNELWESLANQVKLPVTALLFNKIAKGCVEITWLLPCHLTEFIARQLQESTDYFQHENILRVNIAGRCVYQELPSTQEIETDPGRKDKELNTIDIQQQIEQRTCGKPSVCDMVETTTTVTIVTKAQQTQEAVHDHVKMDRTPSPMSIIYADLDQGTSTAFNAWQEDVKNPQSATLQRHFSFPVNPIQPSTSMYCLDIGSENIDPFDVDEHKLSGSLDRWSCHHPRTPLSSTSSSVNVLLPVSRRSLSPISSPSLPSRKRSLQSSSSPASRKQWSLSSSSTSSKHGSRSSSSHSLQRCSLSSSSRSLQRWSRCSSPAMSHLYSSKPCLFPPSPSILDPCEKVNVGGVAGRFGEPMDWSNHSCSLEEMELLKACSRGWVDQVYNLIMTGVDVNVADSEHSATPLYFACQNGHLSVAEQLIAANAVVNTQRRTGATPLYVACQKGYLHVVKCLIAAKADINIPMKTGATPLWIACYNGHHPVVEHLIEAKANVNTPKEDGTTPLYIACQEGYLPVAEQLVAAKAGVNTQRKNGATPLFVACQNGHLQVVKCLITAEADVNTATETGATPLFVACQSGYLPVVQHLVAAKAVVNTPRKDGATPLQIACLNGHLPIVEYLIAAKADVNCQTKKSQETALTMAAWKGSVEIIRKLIQHGADVNLTNKSGTTAFGIASAKGHVDVCQELWMQHSM